VRFDDGGSLGPQLGASSKNLQVSDNQPVYLSPRRRHLLGVYMHNM
jgi:hypothetical protein